MEAKVHDSDLLTPQAAVAEIRRIDGLHGALRQRASGLTWMIWGIVAPAIFVSYTALHLLVTNYRDVGWFFPVLWAPWVALGVVATATLWRSIGLVIPVRAARKREGMLTGLIIVGAIFAGFVFSSAKGDITPDAWVLVAQGVGLIAVGMLGLNVNDALERRLWIVLGLLLIAAGLAGNLLVTGWFPGMSRPPWFNLVSPVTSALVFFGGGFYLTRRA